MRKILTILFTVFFCSAWAQNRSELLMDAYGKLAINECSQAVEDFSVLISTYRSPDARWFMGRGIAEFKIGDYNRALSDFNKAIENNLTDAFLWSARTQVLSGNTKDAVNCIKNYLENCPMPDIESVRKDTLFRLLHNMPEWFVLWQHDYQSDESKLQETAGYYLKREEFTQAHSAIEEGLDKGLNAAILHALNSKIYNAEGNTQLALNEINIALSFDEDNLRYMRQKSALLMKLSMYSDAVDILTGILTAMPEDFEARLERSKAALMTADYDLAKADILIYLKYFKTPDAVYVASQILYRSGNNFEALKYINTLLEKDQSNALWFKLRGMIYYDTRTFDQAAYDLSMSLDLVPEDAETNYYLALAEQKLGNNILACYYMKRAKSYGELRSVSFIREQCKDE
jgi:tetratricopeptide (TPR) repeat protein